MTDGGEGWRSNYSLINDSAGRTPTAVYCAHIQLTVLLDMTQISKVLEQHKKKNITQSECGLTVKAPRCLCVAHSQMLIHVMINMSGYEIL